MAKAYVLIVNKSGTEDSVISNLNHIPSITNTFGTFGAYDIIAKVEHPEKEKLRETITWNIRKLEHVRSTLTLMGIQGQN